MRCECSLQKLYEAVSHAEKVVGKKESLPVLSCILIDVKDSINIRATNLETSISTTVPARVKNKGIIAVPSQVLLQALQTTRGDSVGLKTEVGNVNIISSGGITTIKTVPHEEFPSFPNPPKKKWNKLKTKVFLDGIKSVLYASSQSLIRPELSSVFVSYDDGSLIFAATDSFRLAEKRIKTSITESISDTLIPAKNTLEITTILGNINEEDISVLIDENQVFIDAQSIHIISRAIDGSFPNYQEIIPTSFETEVTLLKEDLATVFKKARIFSNPSQQVSFHVYPQKKIFTVTAQNFDVGETSETIDAAVSGNDIDINFNLRYVSDCLQSIHTDSVTLQFAGDHKPVVVRGISDQSFTYLAMPLNR